MNLNELSYTFQKWASESLERVAEQILCNWKRHELEKAAGYEMMFRIWILVEHSSILAQTEGVKCSYEDWTLMPGFKLISQIEFVHKDWTPAKG